MSNKGKIEVSTESIQSTNSETTKDLLVLLNPNFTDSRLQQEGQLYFCPFNAMIEGVLKYYPYLLDALQIQYVDFPRPRKFIVDLLGENHQGTPLLIIRNHKAKLDSIEVKTSNEISFITGAESILKYLSIMYQIPLLHP